MRLKEFLDLYVQDDTYLEINCIQDSGIFFEGSCAEFKNDKGNNAAGIGWLWLSNIYGADDALVIEVSY